MCVCENVLLEELLGWKAAKLFPRRQASLSCTFTETHSRVYKLIWDLMSLLESKEW